MLVSAQIDHFKSNKTTLYPIWSILKLKWSFFYILEIKSSKSDPRFGTLAYYFRKTKFLAKVDRSVGLRVKSHSIWHACMHGRNWFFFLNLWTFCHLVIIFIEWIRECLIKKRTRIGSNWTLMELEPEGFLNEKKRLSLFLKYLSTSSSPSCSYLRIKDWIF